MSVVANYESQKPVVVFMEPGQSLEDALLIAGFTLTAPDTSSEFPILREFSLQSILVTDVDEKIKRAVEELSLGNLRPVQGFSFLGRIHFT